MPNERACHGVLCGGHAVARPGYSWKHFTAGKINKLLGTTGAFWKSEKVLSSRCATRIIFHRFRKYVAENREKAGLKLDEAIDYQCPIV